MDPTTSEIIALAWADDVPFEIIEKETGLSEPQVIAVMRKNLKPRSYRLWRKRMYGRTGKHGALQKAKNEQTALDHSENKYA